MEIKYQKLLNNQREGLVILDSHKSFTYANPAAHFIFGVVAGNLIGMNIKEFLDTEQLQKILMQRLKETKIERDEYEFVITRLDGTPRIVMVRALPEYNSKGKLAGTLGIFRDITNSKRIEKALVESEKKYRELYESIPVGLFRFVSDSEIVSANNALVQMLGYNTFSELKKNPSFKAFVDPARRNRLFSILIKTGSVENFELRVLRKDGSFIWVSTSISVSLNKEKNISYYDGICEDITERRQARNNIQRMQKLSSIGNLAGGIAHDFNNILTGLFGNIELAKTKLSKNHESYRFIENAIRAFEDATYLTKQFLTFAKGGDPVFKAINLQQIVEDTIAFNLRGSQIEPCYELPENLWPVKADKGQISQVIGNLVINAKQAMPDGGKIYISAENTNEMNIKKIGIVSGKYVKLTIKDEGSGILEEHTDRIYDPYFSTKQFGNGLGLSIVFSIITKHGGYISVTSAIDVGTTFTIWLPAENITKDRDNIDLTSSKVITSTGYILLMDDEEMVCEISSQMIKIFGYRVETAASGEDAVKMYESALLKNDPFDVVIMDLTIPGGMGGKEAVKALLEINPSVKIIVSSGYSTDPVMANYSDYGFKSKLVKPFKMEELKREIGRLINFDN